MDRTRKEILDLYKLRQIHYSKKGMGVKSELSKNTIITPSLVKNTLERYIELGGDENFSDITDEKYKDFLIEMNG